MRRTSCFSDAAGFLLVSLAMCMTVLAEPLILSPVSDVPTVTIAGGRFECELTEQAPLTLVGDKLAYSLAVEWHQPANGGVRATCTVPDAAVPGAYALQAGSGESIQRSARAVFVREEFPEEYRFAHLIGVAADGNGGRVLQRGLAIAAETGGQFVFITGETGADGAKDGLQAQVKALEDYPLPTFLCSGQDDGAYVFRFGRDAYLVFRCPQPDGIEALGPYPARLHMLRREVKAARWAIGVTDRYRHSPIRMVPSLGLAVDLRSQITLFVDDPLDHLVAGGGDRLDQLTLSLQGDSGGDTAVPWGTAPVTVTPTMAGGAVRLFEVGRDGIKAGEVQPLSNGG